MEENKKKINVLLIITIVLFLTILVGATYAYLNATTSNGRTSPAEVTANTIDTLVLSVEDGAGHLQGTDGFTPLNLTANKTNMAEGGTNLIGTLVAKATLTSANIPNHTVDKVYDVNVNITDNNFIYSLGEDKPELLLRVFYKESANGSYTQLNQLPDGTNVKTVTNGAGDQIKGFDITDKNGLINIGIDKHITATTDSNGNETTMEHSWKVQIIYVNYNDFQNENGGHKVNGNILIGTNKIKVESKTIDTIDVKVPRQLSTGEVITKYAYKIKEATAETYGEPVIQAGNTYKFTLLTEDTNYNILVEGLVEGENGNKTETILNTSKTTLTNNLAKYITNYVPTVTSGSGLYHHNGTIKSIDGITTLDANDGNYRYAGRLVNNNICFLNRANQCLEENKYKIIGVFGGKVKVIKKSSLPTPPYISWNEKENKYADGTDNYNKGEWTENGGGKATLNRYLNEDWLNSIGNKINTDKIASVQWQIGGMNFHDFQNKIVPEIYNLELGDSKTEGLSSFTKIGLMYVSDYLYAAPKDKWILCGNSTTDPKQDYSLVYSEDWMYSDDNPWTISRDNDGSKFIFLIHAFGQISAMDSTWSGIRPVFYLESNVKFSSGDGTSNNPYKIDY